MPHLFQALAWQPSECTPTKTAHCQIESKNKKGKAMEAAVVSASHGAMASLLGKLGELLTEKYQLLKGARGEIMFLEAELKSMYVFLEVVSDTEEPDEQDKCWAKEVRELSYDIEDSVNDFIVRVERQPSKPRGFMGFIHRSMNLLTTMNARHEVAKEFEGLKRRVKEVYERRTRYKLDDAVSKPKDTSIDPRLLAIYAETTGLVGIEGPRDQLIQLMDENAQERKVISIVGFGGVGKTTLANEVYSKLEGMFQCRARVSVSQKPNMRMILRMILSHVGFVAPGNTNMEELEMITSMREFLLDKRYFIVVDDIWDASVWDIIRCAFPDNMNGSRVITTTRIADVARACCTDHPEYVYKMEPLTDQNSRRLFFKRVFGSEDACPPFLKEVSAEILNKCGGLPLAITTMSSLLANQPNRQQWDDVRNSLGSNFEMSPSLKSMRQILNLSYVHLPQCLKTCMLYLGIYPEDYTIDKNDLVRQWVAQGFISKAHGTDPEYVAKNYFNELINRSMIQPTDTDYNGEVMSCRVHDMMLDLILCKSREDNFITVTSDILQDMKGQREKIRRLSLHMDGAIDDEVMRSVHPLLKLRTVARFATTSYSLDLFNLRSINKFEILEGSRSSYFPALKQFRHLQVLKIEILRGSGTPVLLDFTGICDLFHLRYLNIATDWDPVVLPSKIGGLQQLQTFQLQNVVKSSRGPSGGQSFEELPSDIVHMSWLLHLTIPLCRRLPNGIGKMKSLRTLNSFDLSTNSAANIKGLGELTNLTDLTVGCRSDCHDFITDDDEVVETGREVLRTCLEKLCNLKYLDICTYGVQGACIDVSSSVPASFCNLRRFRALSLWFSRVPGWIGKLHNLYDLVLAVKEVLEDDVGMLAQLLSLNHLNLYINGTPKDKIIIHGSGFPELKHFRIFCNRISYLTFEAGAMAKLQILKLGFNALGWDRHGGAPAGIEHLAGLKEISVEICAGGAKGSNRRAAEAALRNVVDMHPSHPAANINCDARSLFRFDDMEEAEREEEDGGESSST